VIHFLNESQSYFQLARPDQATLDRVLAGWYTMVTQAERLAAADEASRTRLRAAYRLAVEVLLSQAAATLHTSMQALYLVYRYDRTLIPDWADIQVAGVTTSMPMGARPDAITGEVTMMISGVRVIFLPDGTKRSPGARTNAHWDFNNAVHWDTRGGVVVAHNGPDIPEVRIRTRYGPGLTSASPSAYGRGTTQADVAAGHTSLGFHEGSHGRDYLQFLVTHTFPAFTGRDGMTNAQFRHAVRQYVAACRQYEHQLTRSPNFKPTVSAPQ
jgi:hypothetical protein